jgi:CHAT domain-containing protein
LKYTGEEVFKARQWMKGDAIFGKKAIKSVFEDTVKHYRVVHLATHGKANDKIGDYSFLAFSEQKDSLDNELLYVRDIYNLNLNADLVLLSACETGIGELKRGEGVISLARAFAYAGAKSLITTLWSVNDKSSMKIMESFYRRLKKEMPIHTALQQAKMEYFKNISDEKRAHPYYWSGFITIGDVSPLKP